jgi:hypothetical protein
MALVRNHPANNYCRDGDLSRLFNRTVLLTLLYLLCDWYSSILEHRQRVINNLAETPSLKSFLVEAVEKAYPDARKLAKFGVQIPQESEYPTVCPFSIEQILDEDFYGL